MAIHAPEITSDGAGEIASDVAPRAVDVPDVPPLDGNGADGTDGRQEAMWAALVANPGTSATAVGAAAGMSRMAAGKILNQLESEGRARRVAGGYDGQGRGRTPDRWYPIITDATTSDAPSAPDRDGPDSPCAPDTSASAAEVVINGAPTPDTPSMGIAETQNEPEATANAESPVSTDIDAGEVSPAAEAPETEDGPAPNSPTAAVLDERLERDEDAPDTEPGAEEDPAREQARAELLELAELLLGTAAAMEADGDAVLALGRLEMAMAKAPQVHRTVRSVLTGTTPPPARTATRASVQDARTTGTVRHGALRDRVLAHLTEHPGKEFTPYEIGRVLDSSSGAVANALDRLVSLGQAELTCERPRRFALADAPDSGR
ncbi:hypothetical protein ABZ912_47975 [Nonomuraea angiospora]|uniref:hypothetical protein n=1 Tax=Nonomuraea angiospora TaxID=46172 RepID=UPI0033D4EF13